MRTPVLFLVFNRPATTSSVFAAIRAAAPPRLYVAADGPRQDRSEEAACCEKVRSIATAVDWPCEVQTLFRDTNLGCKNAVSGAISWFFEHEDEGIILEDDCLPSSTFFRYCEELLARFRHDTRIMSIAATNMQGRCPDADPSYFFSRYSLMWGWATWRRAWRHYDLSMRDWPRLRGQGWLRGIGEGSWLFARVWRRIFDACFAGRIDTWDYQWIYSCWLQGGASILPCTNLVRNLGIGENATHTIFHHDILSTLQEAQIEFPLRHPGYIARNHEADRFLDRHWFHVDWKGELRGSLEELLAGGALARLTRPLRTRLRRRANRGPAR